MVKPLTQELLDELGNPHGRFPWVLFAELSISANVTANTVFRVTRYTTELSFLGKTWYPFGFKVSGIVASNAGELPRVKIELDDPTGVVRSWMNVADAFRGRPIRIYWAHWATIDLGHYINWDFDVVSADVDSEKVELTCRWANFFDEPFPHDSFVRGRCRWMQGSLECGDYRRNVDCGRTLAGCLAVAEDWRSAGFYPMHPRRYNGFDSIPSPKR
jgi:hypothetical protein